MHVGNFTRNGAKKLKEIGQKKIYSLEELSEYERLAHDVINKLEEYAEIQEV